MNSETTSKTLLYIGIPTYGAARMEFSVDSLATLLYHIGRNHPEIDNIVVHRDVRTYRQEARRGIVEAAIQAEATHLLMLDDDHVFSGDEFDLIWGSMQKDPENVRVCSGLYFTRGLPTAPCIFSLSSEGTVPIYYYPPNSLFEVDVVGFGFILFDMSVFSRINPPWFNLGTGFGEDAAFCARCIQAGIKIWVHTGAEVGHILEQPYVISSKDYLPHRGSIREPVGTPKLGIVSPPPQSEQPGGELPTGEGPERSKFRPRTRRWWFKRGGMSHVDLPFRGAGEETTSEDRSSA